MSGGVRGRLLAVSLVLMTGTFAAAYWEFRSRVESVPGLAGEVRQGVLGEVDRLALWMAAGTVLLSLTLSTVAGAVATRIARRLALLARKMADGDVGAVPSSDDDEEFGELGLALRQLANGYASVLADYRRERDRMRGILAGMREGVLLFDRKRRVTLVNAALREMLLLPAEVQGKTPLEVIRHPEIVRLLDEAQGGAEAASEIELTGLKPRRLLVQVVRVSGEEGGLLSVFIDVTHLRRLESLRKDFVANASHELRTPVAAILSAAETLETAATRDPVGAAEFIELIQRNAARLRNLVDDLLDLSRIESQDFQVHLERLEAREAARAVLDLFGDRARKKQIELRIEPGPPCEVFADRRALEHVLTNLVDNAVKYCGTGSTISVAAEARAGHAELVVSDDGPGIAEQHLQRIFERFYRVDPGRSRQLGGTGLGLSIVKHLAEAMGGSVSVESELGRGTKFVVRLLVPTPEAKA